MKKENNENTQSYIEYLKKLMFQIMFVPANRFNKK